MHYKTVSVSRSLHNVKVKPTSRSGRKDLAADRAVAVKNSRDGERVSSGVRGQADVVPAWFLQAPSSSANIALPAESDSFWMPVLLAIALALALAVGLYFGLRDDIEPVQALRPVAIQAPPVETKIPNISPMENTFNSRSTNVRARKRPSASVAPTLRTTDVLLDGKQRYVLPAEVSGACNIGTDSGNDFAACLVHNGARVR